MISGLINQAATRLAQIQEDMGEPLISTVSGLISQAASLPVEVLESQIRRSLSDVTKPFEERVTGLAFAGHPSISQRILRRAVGREHLVYNLMGLQETVGSLSLALGHYALMVGATQFLQDYQNTLVGENRLPPNPEFVEWGRLHVARWNRKYARANELNVRFEGVERIPQEGPVVYGLFPHTSIFPDFFLTFVDPRVMHVADVYNFRDNQAARRGGAALLFDRMGIPMVDRRNPERSKVLFNELVDASALYGIRNAWFPHGGRIPRAYEDDGRSARAGFYSNVPNPADPKTYIQTEGLAANAVALAKKTGQTVRVVVMTLRGAEFVMPKKTRSFPFIQPNLAGETITYRVVDVLDVPPPDAGRNSLRQIVTLARGVPKIAKDDLGIDLYLRSVVDGWRSCLGQPNSGEIFAERSAREETYLILADRIRSIHPSHPERSLFAQRLIDALHKASAPESNELEGFLGEVSEVLLRVQYS